MNKIPMLEKFAVQSLVEHDGELIFSKEKFAELIVRECCDWIDGSPSTDAGQLLLTKSFIIANLKGHFSVGS